MSNKNQSQIMTIPGKGPANAAKKRPIPILGMWGIVLFGLAAAGLALKALGIMSDYNPEVYRFSSAGWGRYADVIVRVRMEALWHGCILALGGGLVLWALFRSSARAMARVFLPWMFVAIVALDALWLSRHYIKAMPAAALEENGVIKVLKTVLPEKRAALVSQDGFYNLWLTYLFPYHGIKTINITQMPRMPADYTKFFEAVGRNPLRLWQLSAVGFVLAPEQVWAQIRNDPAMKDAFEVVYAYDVKPLVSRGKPADCAVEVVPSASGQHVVMRLLKPSPRFALIAAWEKVDDSEALRRLGANDYQLFKKVMIAPECAADLPDFPAPREDGQVQLLEYRPGIMKLRTSAQCPSILRVTEKYDRDWRVRVDGKTGRVLRADFIFLGIPLETGLHEVVLEYAPPRWPLTVQGMGFLIVAGAIVVLLCRRKCSACGSRN